MVATVSVYTEEYSYVSGRETGQGELKIFHVSMIKAHLYKED